MWCKAVAVGLVAGMLVVPAAGAKTYKWVDEKGVTHYGDRIPPQYAAPKAQVVAQPLSPEERKAREQEAKRQLEQRRQDTALLATYANTQEIEAARSRELKRVQEWLAINSAGLAKSKSNDDRKNLESVIEQARKETDAINAKYDAQKARYQELRAGQSG